MVSIHISAAAAPPWLPFVLVAAGLCMIGLLWAVFKKMG